MGHGLLTYYFLGPSCGGTMTWTNCLGGLLQVEHGPRTTASVPCHFGEFAGPGPCTRTALFFGGGGIRPGVRHGVLEEEVVATMCQFKIAAPWNANRGTKTGKGKIVWMYRAQTSSCMVPRGLCP